MLYNGKTERHHRIAEGSFENTRATRDSLTRGVASLTFPFRCRVAVRPGYFLA